MKKYGIITHYHISNHGAMLQLQALIHVLKSLGIEAKALRFEKSFDYIDEDTRNKYRFSLRSIPYFLKFLHENGLRKTWFNFRKVRKFNRFKRESNIIGEYYSLAKDLDGIIVGSDEVFALHTGPTPAFFGHACPTENIFAYAASFGPTNYEDIERLHCIPFVKSGLESMKAISVRDNNTADIVEKLTGKKPLKVCDPVILYGYQKEIEDFGKLDHQPYLLIYAYDNNMNDPVEVDMIKTFAKKHGLKIVAPGFYHCWCDEVINAGPIEILKYFKNADFIVTDTFHGSVMSLITNRNFAVITRNNKNKLVNLLDEYGQVGRILSEEVTLDSLYEHPIDYTAVNEEMAKRRKESFQYLSLSLTLPHREGTLSSSSLSSSLEKNEY